MVEFDNQDMNQRNPEDWKERQLPLQDVVLSNSWALQAILQFLDEVYPGARDRIWEHYVAMKNEADRANTNLRQELDKQDDYDDFEDER